MAVSKKRGTISGLDPDQVIPLLKPVVEPVLERLDRLEKLVQDMDRGLQIQFKRTAAVQAQLDRLVAHISKPEKPRRP